MSFNYSPIAATASRLLSEFGFTAFVRSASITASDPVEGTVTTRRPVDVPVNCIEQSITEQTAQGFAIESGDKIVLIDKAATVRDEIIINGAAWEIIAVIPVKPSTVDIVWKIQLRK